MPWSLKEQSLFTIDEVFILYQSYCALGLPGSFIWTDAWRNPRSWAGVGNEQSVWCMIQSLSSWPGLESIVECQGVG
jgi:hypothetical protein